MKSYLLSVFASIALAAGMYAVGVQLWGSSEFAANLDLVSFEVWIALLALSLVNYLLRFFRWTRYIALNCQCSMPYNQHLLVYFSGFALTTTPGKAGEALRSTYLNQAGVSISNSLSALFSERLVDLLCIVILSLFLVNSEIGSTPLWSIPFALGVSIFVFIAIHSDTLKKVSNFLTQRSSGFLSKILSYARSMLDASRKMLTVREFTIGSTIGFVAWFAEAFGFCILVQHLGIEVEFAIAVGIYGLAMLAGALSFIPGGLGSTELVMGGLLVAFGADQVDAITATLVCRIVTLWFAVVLGILSAAFLAILGITPKLSEV